MKRELIFKLLFGVAVGMIIAFCFRINPLRDYGWWGGIWQGCLGIYHWVLSWFDSDILVIAPERTIWYDIFWWAAMVINAGALLLIVIRLIIPLKKGK